MFEKNRKITVNDVTNDTDDVTNDTDDMSKMWMASLRSEMPRWEKSSKRMLLKRYFSGILEFLQKNWNKFGRNNYRVCHGFRLIKQDDYFRVNFD